MCVLPSVYAAAEAPAGRHFTGETTLIRGGVCSSQGCCGGETKSLQHTQTHTRSHKKNIYSKSLEKVFSVATVIFFSAYSRHIWPPGNCSFLHSVRSDSPCKLRLHNWCIFSWRVQHQHKWHLCFV